MASRVSRSLLVAAGVVVLVLGASRPAALASSSRSIHLAPSKVRVGTTARLTGSGLGAREYYSFILALPSARKPSIEQFIGVGRTDGSGRISVKVHVPLVLRCGKGVVIALNSRTRSTTSTNVTLTGCTAPKGVISFPSLPKHPKSHTGHP